MRVRRPQEGALQGWRRAALPFAAVDVVGNPARGHGRIFARRLPVVHGGPGRCNILGEENGVVPYQMPPVAKAYIMLQVMPR